ncbi:MAG: hypothetical protein AAGU76_10165 [Sedimentibacter sp.]|uniref:hypothetical protein n=1 Tax=Sedimentibacter sp. TaxID=1960295 RepID=UPI003158254E
MEKSIKDEIKKYYGGIAKKVAKESDILGEAYYKIDKEARSIRWSLCRCTC